MNDTSSTLLSLNFTYRHKLWEPELDQKWCKGLSSVHKRKVQVLTRTIPYECYGLGGLTNEIRRQIKDIEAEQKAKGYVYDICGEKTSTPVSLLLIDDDRICTHPVFEITTGLWQIEKELGIPVVEFSNTTIIVPQEGWYSIPHVRVGIEGKYMPLPKEFWVKERPVNIQDLYPTI